MKKPGVKEILKAAVMGITLASASEFPSKSDVINMCHQNRYDINNTCINLFARIDKRGPQSEHAQKHEQEHAQMVQKTTQDNCANTLTGKVTIGATEYSLEKEEDDILSLYDYNGYRLAWRSCDSNNSSDIYTRTGSEEEINAFTFFPEAASAMKLMNQAQKDVFMAVLGALRSKVHDSDIRK